MEVIICLVKNTLEDIVQAIDGQIIMSPELAACIKAIFDLRVPHNFAYDPSGAEISWLNPTGGLY